jgi:hypothetical protein
MVNVSQKLECRHLFALVIDLEVTYTWTCDRHCFKCLIEQQTFPCQGT